MSNPTIDEITNRLNRVSSTRGSRIIVLAADDEQTMLGIRTPFNSHWIEEMKSRIPSTERAWMPESRAWFVNPTYYNVILSVCSRYFNYEYRIVQINTVGLELLQPVKQPGKRPVLANDLTRDTVKALSEVKVREPMDDKIMFETIIEAYKSGAISNEKALELIDELVHSWS